LLDVLTASGCDARVVRESHPVSPVLQRMVETTVLPTVRRLVRARVNSPRARRVPAPPTRADGAPAATHQLSRPAKARESWVGMATAYDRHSTCS